MNCTNPSCFKNNTKVWRECELEVNLKLVHLGQKKTPQNLSTTIGLKLSSLFEKPVFYLEMTV